MRIRRRRWGPGPGRRIISGSRIVPGPVIPLLTLEGGASDKAGNTTNSSANSGGPNRIHLTILIGAGTKSQSEADNNDLLHRTRSFNHSIGIAFTAVLSPKGMPSINNCGMAFMGGIMSNFRVHAS